MKRRSFIAGLVASFVAPKTPIAVATEQITKPIVGRGFTTPIFVVDEAPFFSEVFYPTVVVQPMFEHVHDVPIFRCKQILSPTIDEEII